MHFLTTVFLTLIASHHCEAVVNTGLLGSTIVDSGTMVISLVDFISSQGTMPRGIVVAINNRSGQDLWGPSEYTKEGVVSSIPPDTIPDKNVSMIRFEKKQSKWIWTGAIGVVSYNIGNTGNQLTIMYKVPWNQLADKNAFNVRIKQNAEASKTLLEELLNTDSSNVMEANMIVAQDSRSELGYKFDVQLTNSAKASMLVELSTI